MIFPTAEEAYGYAEAQAHLFEALEVLSDGTFRVVLEAPDLAPVPPGRVTPETPVLPEGLHVVSSVVPEMPEHVQKLEAALRRILLPHHDPEKRALGEREHKWPELSPFWVKTIARAYFFRKRNIVYRVGRRGGKSSTLSRVAAAEVLFGDHHVPGGDTGVFAIVSQDRKNAADRINTIDEILSDLGIDHKTTQGLIRIPSLNREVAVYTASVGGVSGFTSIGCLCDEVSKWKDKDSDANPGHQVLQSLRPTMATQPNAVMWLISSPWSTDDAHYEAFERGTTGGQVCFYAPTWIANPTLTEDQCRKDSPVDQEFECEYRAIPMAASEEKFFAGDRIEEAKTIRFALHHSVTKSGGDLAFRKNSTAICVVEAGTAEDGKEAYKLWSDHEWVPSTHSLRVSDVLGEIIRILSRRGVEAICTDLHYIESLREELEQTEISLEEFDSSKKDQAYMRVRYLLTAGRIDLSRASPDLVSQLEQTRVSPGTGGKLSVRNPETGGKHGDIVDALVCAIWSFEANGSAGIGGERRFEDHVADEEWHEFSEEAFQD